MTSTDLRLQQIGHVIQAMYARREEGICLSSDQEQLEALIADAAKLSKPAKRKTAQQKTHPD